MVGSQNLIITIHHRLVKIGMFDKALVDKKELFAISSPGMFRYPNKSTDL